MRFAVVPFRIGGLMVFMAFITGIGDSNGGPVPAKLFEKVKVQLAAPGKSDPTRASRAAVYPSKPLSNQLPVLLAIRSEPTRTQTSDESRSPTYLRDVQPIFMGKCFRCHNDRTRFLNNWLDYRTALEDRHELKRRVWDSWKGAYFKQPMPILNTPEADALTEEERKVIRDWVVSGALRGVQPKHSDPRSKEERMQVGKQLFTTICAACHQPTAQGIPDRFPPLAHSDFLNSNKQRAIGVLLHGLQGEVVVNGHKFNNSMPVFPFSDAQIAAALTYVYSSFGNSGQDVTTEEVKSLRGRNDFLSSIPGQGTKPSNPVEKSPWE